MSLTICQSKLLHEVRGLSHQDVVGPNLGCQCLGGLHELLIEDCFSVLEKIREELKRHDVGLLGQNSEGAVLELRQTVALLGDVGDHVFADLHHEDSVVSLCGQGSMCLGNIVTKLVVRQITLPTAPLSAD